MALDQVAIGSVKVSRLVLGGNPFSGFSHQGADRDRQMRRFYTVERIKQTLRRAEQAGINTFFGRADNFVMRVLEEYWSEGGTLQWFAQTAAEQTDHLGCIDSAAATGAKGCYLHGGQSDVYFHQGRTDLFAPALARMREGGMAGGFAAHNVGPHEWIRDHLKPDFQMCCYYDPSMRLDRPNHVASDAEKYDPAHRDEMTRFIQTLRCPAVHYKVLAAGRLPPEEAFRYVAGVLRPRDVVCVGFHLGDDPDLIEKTVNLFEKIVRPATA
jgi:hypothetical protein